VTDRHAGLPRCAIAHVSPQAGHPSPGGGRTWWAHLQFTRIDIEPIIIRKKIEELRILFAICVV
jgi:hypothetical protein